MLYAGVPQITWGLISKKTPKPVNSIKINQNTIHNEIKISDKFCNVNVTLQVRLGTVNKSN